MLNKQNRLWEWNKVKNQNLFLPPVLIQLYQLLCRCCTATVNFLFSVYFEPKEIAPYLDGINLFAFDYLTAEKKITPEVADYPAPLYPSYDRTPDFNVDSTVMWFIRNQAPRKLIDCREWNISSALGSQYKRYDQIVQTFSYYWLWLNRRELGVWWFGTHQKVIVI